MDFDYIIIGGGITGLYTVEQLLNKYNESKKILLLDERTYFGGRLITHKNPHYEIGGARFNNNHVLLLKLIQKYKLTKIGISNNVDYIEKSNNQINYHKDVNKTFDYLMKMIVKESKKFSKKYLITFTFQEFINNISETKDLSKCLIQIFGYNSEFTKMNAYDSIRSFENDFIAKKYFVLKEGFSELCLRIVKNNKKKIDFRLKHKVNNIEKKDNNYIVSCYDMENNKDVLFNGKKIIIAIKSEQLRNFSILKPIIPYLKCLYNAPLLRIYAIYPLDKNTKKVWFYDLPKITTNSFLRHIIPINKDNGLIMISYTDGVDTDIFMENKSKGIIKKDEKIKKMINDELKILFPNLIIPKPSYFKSHIWNVGAHHWKPNCDSKKIYNKIKSPIQNIFIVGEAFSQKQAWIEGGLETVNDVIDKL
tara:strand:+ start:11833 stop:13095 length:1263 start_codon:yes stop_codon:yes gene_type:complete